MTVLRIRAATGTDPLRAWGALVTNYLGGLAQRGLVVRGRVLGAGATGPRVLYALTPAALDLLGGCRDAG